MIQLEPKNDKLVEKAVDEPRIKTKRTKLPTMYEDYQTV